MAAKFKVGDLVLVGASVARAMPGPEMKVHEVTVCEVTLVVESGEDYHGPIKTVGYVLKRVGQNPGYPYVWDERRLSKKEQP